MNDRRNGIEEGKRVIACELPDGVRQSGRRERASGHDHAVPIRRRRSGNLSARALTTATTSACPAPLFADGFESGDLSRWTTVAGLQTSSAQARSGAWSARAATTTGAAAYAITQLDTAQTDLYTTLWFKLDALGANVVDLLKLRTATGTALLTVFASPTGVLGYQNNVTTLSTYSKTPISRSAWHTLTVHTLINGQTSKTETWLDGQPVPDLSKTESLGSTPIARIQIGENITGRTYDVSFDDVVLTRTPPVP